MATLEWVGLRGREGRGDGGNMLVCMTMFLNLHYIMSLPRRDLI